MTARIASSHLKLSDIRGIAQLATEGTTGVTRIVEGVHRSVLDTIGLPGTGKASPIRGITGLVYKSIFGATRFVGKGLDEALASLQPRFESGDIISPESPRREAFLSVLNGVVGDRMVESNNPLAIPMTLRHQNQALCWNEPPKQSAVTGKVLVLVHGLCVNERSWQTENEGRVMDHGQALAAALGYTVVYLRYNSGRHISENGRDLSAQLEQLATHWPVPIEELSVLAHSMGGLLARSACHYAGQCSLRWPAHLKSIVFLGTPHHGAPLERAGSWVGALMGRTPYTAPFSRLGRLRSAGITDLRYGNVLDEDWQSHDRFLHGPDNREYLPLPANVRCYAVAATTASEASGVGSHLIGDGLVPLRSALGRHDDVRRCLDFARDAEYVACRMHHMDLLGSPKVSKQIVKWLTPNPAQ